MYSCVAILTNLAATLLHPQVREVTFLPVWCLATNQCIQMTTRLATQLWLNMYVSHYKPLGFAGEVVAPDQVTLPQHLTHEWSNPSKEDVVPS